MKKIGILGGLGPESTVIYYKYIIHEYHKRFGNYAFPEIVIYSVNFQRFIDLFGEDRWDEVTEETVRGLNSINKAGADFGIIATNTLHAIFSKVQQRTSFPLISIMEPVAEAIKGENIQKVGLLGTIFTMGKSFYADRLMKERIHTIVPRIEDQQRIQKIIASELTIGEIKQESKDFFLAVVESLRREGAEGIILGCTEIPLLLTQDDCKLRLFNSTILHAESALRFALE